MSIHTHGEYEAIVDRRLPWGVVAALEDGTNVLIDTVKAGEDPPPPGARVVLVVLDDARIPIRGSLLAVDKEVAKRMRGRLDL